MDIFDSRYFSLNKRLSTWIGLWPYGKEKKYRIRTFWLLAVTILTVPQIIGIKVNYSNPEKVMEHTAIILFISVVFFKLSALILAEGNLKLTYNGIIENWTMIIEKEETAILAKYSERGRKMTIFYLTFMIASYFTVVLPPMTPIILDQIIPLAKPRSRMYIFHGEYLVENKDDHYFKIYLCDNFLMFTLVLINVSMDTMYAACVEHCVGIFSIVKHRLRSINLFINQIEIPSKENEFYEYMLQTIQLHQRILNFTQTLEASYSICFLMLTLITIALAPLACVLIISSLDSPVAFLRYTIGLGCIGTHLFYLCYPGQRLIDVSNGIFTDTYHNEWYRISPRMKKLLRFLMLRSTKPSLITAGRFMAMNMENYLTITKTAMSYITVLASAR